MLDYENPYDKEEYPEEFKKIEAEKDRLNHART